MSEVTVNSIENMEFWCPICKKQHVYDRCEFKGLCNWCKIRPSTLHFGDMLSFTHGGSENCCEIWNCYWSGSKQGEEFSAARIPSIVYKKGNTVDKISLEDLQKVFGWTEKEAKQMAAYKKSSFPSAERASRRKIGKRARVARKVNRNV